MSLFQHVVFRLGLWLVHRQLGEGTVPKTSSYGSPEALWIEHTLEPFRRWLEKLHAAAGIVFIDYDGVTEAKLLQGGDQIPELTVEVVRRSLLIGRIDL